LSGYLPFGRSMAAHGTRTRQQILRAAMRRFAHCGYAAASVQEIVDEARVSKPALYYHFGDKAGLYRALVDFAFDERYRLMQEAVKRGRTTRERLVEIAAAVFEFTAANRDLMRLAFSAVFAAPGEVPAELAHFAKGRRNYEFVRSLIEEGQAAGELDAGFDSEELAFGLYGLWNNYIMVRLLWPGCTLDRRTARRVVELFLTGAAVKRKLRS
jgi:TetR/AcrR family transcriptional regulator